MASIIIKDLAESVDLDREAMIAISGGARTRGRQPFAGSAIFRSTRIVNFPRGFITPLSERQTAEGKQCK